MIFNAIFTDAGQLVLSLNGTEVPQTRVGKTENGEQLESISVINVDAADSVISVINPTDSTTNIELSQSTGGNGTVASQLTIIKIA